MGPPRRNLNPLVYVLAGCGGCLIVAILLGALAFGRFVQTIRPLIARSRTTSTFVGDLVQHDFRGAEAQLTPEYQQQLPVSALKAQVARLEKRYGPIEGSRRSLVVVGPNPAGASQFRYVVRFGHGWQAVTLDCDVTKTGGNRIDKMTWSAASDDEIQEAKIRQRRFRPGR